jgi:hypothetical protein
MSPDRRCAWRLSRSFWAERGERSSRTPQHPTSALLINKINCNSVGNDAALETFVQQALYGSAAALGVVER